MPGSKALRGALATGAVGPAMVLLRAFAVRLVMTVAETVHGTPRTQHLAFPTPNRSGWAARRPSVSYISSDRRSERGVG